MTSIRTCESTCIGHPDKLCDLIADTILDDLLFEDLSARCAVEVMATKGWIIVAGEITSSVKVSIRAAVRRALTRTGGEGAFVLTGAGDQGTVYGYATDETPEYLPLPLVIAHEICKRLDAARMGGHHQRYQLGRQIPSLTALRGRARGGSCGCGRVYPAHPTRPQHG